MIAHGASFQTLYGGRTNRVWKVMDRGRDKVLKLYDTTLDNPLFRNDARLEATCLQALSETGMAPRLRASGHFGKDGWVLYDHAPGTPWQKGVECVARLLRRLHDMNPPVAAPSGRNGSAELARHGSEILSLCHDKRRKTLQDLMPETSVPPTARICLIHGDPVAGNILTSPSGAMLIDWQCPAVGDRCEDLALFLSPAMQRIYRGRPLTHDQEFRFLQAYGCPETAERYRELKPWYAWRMAAYCLWRVEHGAPAYEDGLMLELAGLAEAR
ncbi:MAG: hypothetical protein Tsb0024_01060 [Ruegeria sp.]